MANWTLNGMITTSTSQVVAPNRSTTAQDIARQSSAAYLSMADITTTVPALSYTAAVYVKRENNNFFCIRVGETLSTNYAEACYDLTAGTTGRVNVVGDITMQDPFIHNIGDGWFVVGISFTTGQAYNMDLFVTPTNALETRVDEAVPAALNCVIWNPTFEKRDNLEESYLGTNITEVSAVEDGFLFLPIFTANTTSVSYETSNRQIITINFDPSAEFNTASAVSYVSIPQQRSHGFPTSFTVNDNKLGSRTIRINREPRYDKRQPAEVTFINKQGVLETFWMSKRHTFGQESKHDMYYRNVIDYNDFSYDVHRHTAQKYNVVSHENIVLNTDFIGLDQNRVIRELIQSEYVWVTIQEDLTDATSVRTFPVIMMDKSVNYKTHVNDQLIQYTFKFKYAHRLDNTIR